VAADPVDDELGHGCGVAEDLPTGPEALPDWTAETRIAGWWSPAHHRPCSGGIVRCRHESRTA
jgi:hypothetical protein